MLPAVTELENYSTPMIIVALALRDGNGRWLLHKRPPRKEHGNLWEFPGGKLEPGENLRTALVREAKEELNITLDAAALRPLVFADQRAEGERSERVILLYTCERWTGDPRPLEGGALQWFSGREVGDLPKPPLDIALWRQICAIRPA